MPSSTEMVECPDCNFMVYEHTLDMKCFAHIPGDDLAARQRAQEAEREKEYSGETD